MVWFQQEFLPQNPTYRSVAILSLNVMIHDLEKFHEQGIFIADAEQDKDYRVLRNMIASSDIVVDAIFGIGVHLPIRKIPAQVMRNVNRVMNELQADSGSPTLVDPTGSPTRQSVPYIIAVDCPSGLDCDTGEVDKNVNSCLMRR